jgi:protein SCO1/2
MKRLIICFGLLMAIAIQSQVYEPGSNEEIGVKEHLGETIPLDLTFTDEVGEFVDLKDLIDKPTILSFVYFDCPGICTPLLENLSDVMQQMDLKLGEDYKVLSISFNKKDDPVKAEKKKKNLVCQNCTAQEKHWRYLTGDSAAIEKILTSVGFAVKRTGNDYLHAGAIIIVSPEGKITRYLYGIRFMPMDLKLALIEAQDGLARPTIHRVLNFCYSYDPVGKRYGLELTKLIGTFILIILAIVFAILLFRRKKKKTDNS